MRRPNIIKRSVSFQLTYIFNAILIKTPVKLFAEIYKMTLKYRRKQKKMFP